MSDTKKGVDDALYQKITDICLENGGVTKPMVDELYALFAKQLKEAETRFRRLYAKRNHHYPRKWIADFLGISRPTLNKWLENPELFTIGAIIKLSTLDQDTKGGTDEDLLHGV